jgi:hypothetical protein
MPPHCYIQIDLTVFVQEWDTYLTEYATSLPTSRDRAGLFRPPSYSFWDRLFPWMHRSKPPVVSEYLFPPDDKYTCPPHLSFDQRKTQSMMQSVLTHDNSPNFSRRQTQDPLARLRGFGNAGVHGYRKREAVKFGAVNPDDLSSDDEDDPLSTPPPLARRTSTLSSLTLTNGSNGFLEDFSNEGRSGERRPREACSITRPRERCTGLL